MRRDDFVDACIFSCSLGFNLFSEAILGNISLPPQFMGSALGFIHWQKVPAVMHFIFTNTLLKRVSQIYEVL